MLLHYINIWAYCLPLCYLGTKLKLATQARKAIFAIKAYQKHFGHFSHSEHFKLFDSIIKPILLYGKEIWDTSIAIEIEIEQVKFCKELLRVNKTTN